MSTYSELVENILLSPNRNSPRDNTVKRITPHCVVGQSTAKAVAEMFSKPARQASSNYVIGKDGEVWLCVDEEDRSWCSSSRANDHQAITIECASDATAPYAFNDTVYNKLIDLCIDICQRYGKTKLVWISDKDTALAYTVADDELQLTVHRWFAAVECPGDWLMGKMQDLADTVTAALVIPTSSDENATYYVQIGAFQEYENAKKYADNFNEADIGWYAFVFDCDDELYRVKVGPLEQDEANRCCDDIVSYLGDKYDYFITDSTTGTMVDETKQATATTDLKTNEEVAMEVIRGEWGNGTERKERLTAAGYSYAAVQSLVNSYMKNA